MLATAELAPREGDGVTRGQGFDKAALCPRSNGMLGFFRNDSRRAVITALHERLVAASRRPELYARLGVPDTLEGRFEALTLHAVIVLHALRGRHAPADEVGQELVDAVFRGLEASLREMGVGDVAVPKRMKRLAEAFYGRARAYDAPLDAGDAAGLAAALARNVYAGERQALGLARYALDARRALEAVALDALLRDGPVFPSPRATCAGDAASEARA